MTVTRRTAREWAIQMLTAADLNPPGDVEAFVASQVEQISDVAREVGDGRIHGKLLAFAVERVKGVFEKQDEIDAALGAALENWSLDRLGTVERAVLRLGCWERKFSDVPKAVVINEAVDLVNWFSTPKSRSLVNGVLDRIV